MTKQSAGILLFRHAAAGLECLLCHPGGPFWAKKDGGAWTIPKGEFGPGEEAEAAARREFLEETGWPIPGPLIPLGEAVQPSRKRVLAFACEGDFACERLKSNHFEMEWPPRSGALRRFPEIDRAEWFAPELARNKILPGQRVFIDRLVSLVCADRRS